MKLITNILKIFTLFIFLCVVISCNTKSFDNLVFEDVEYTYDGLEKEIKVNNLPEGAIVKYIPNNKYKEVGTYEVEAIVTKEGYETVTLKATLEIKAKTFDNLVFEDAEYTYDGLEKEIIVNNLPEGAIVKYIPNNKYKEAGTYEVEAIVTKEGYNTVTLKAKIVIKESYVNVTFIDEDDTQTIIEVVKHKQFEPIEEKGKVAYKLKYWAYKDSEDNLVEYDFNSLITEDIELYAVYEYDEEQNLPLSIEVKLTNNGYELNDTYKPFVGEEIVVEIKCYPESSIENVIIHINDDSLGEIEGNIIKTKKPGRLKVYCRSNKYNVTSNVSEVVIKVNNAEGIDLNGYNIVVQYSRNFNTYCYSEDYSEEDNNKILELIDNIQKKI